MPRKDEKMRDILMVLWGAGIASGWWATAIFGDGIWIIGAVFLSLGLLIYILKSALEVMP